MAKKPKRVETDFARRFLDADSDELADYIEKGWVEGVDYKTLLNDSQVLILGDTNHNQTGIIGGIANHLNKLKEAGVRYLGIECPREEKYIGAVKEFNETGNVSKISKLVEETRTSVRTTRLLKNARDVGLEICLIDMPEAEVEKLPEKKQSKERGRYMGREIAKIIENKDDKIAVFCGYAHLAQNQIPKELRKKGIKHKKIALVTAGQPDASIPTAPFTSLGAVAAVAQKGLQKNCGYVSLNKYGIDGFIHFPKVQLIEMLKGNELVVAEHGPRYELMLLGNKASLPAISYDFGSNITPSGWEDTNTKKIFEMINNIAGLNNTQKFYLGMMLENYVRLSMRHGGGSIFNIEFDPEARAFGIDTVDALGHPFKPDVDYGSLSSHREVTLETLLSQYGFADIIIKDIKDLPETDIRPNPDNPESIYKFLLLLSAYATHPERILGVWNANLKIARAGQKEYDDNYIAKLEVDDFELNHLEKAIINVAGNLTNYANNNDVYGILIACHENKLPQILKKDLDEISDCLSKYDKDSLGFILGAWDLILEARKKLEYVSKDEAEKFLNYLEKRVKAFKTGSEEANELASKHSHFYDTPIKLRPLKNRERAPERCFKDAVQESINVYNSTLSEINKLKSMFDSYYKPHTVVSVDSKFLEGS